MKLGNYYEKFYYKINLLTVGTVGNFFPFWSNFRSFESLCNSTMAHFLQISAKKLKLKNNQKIPTVPEILANRLLF